MLLVEAGPRIETIAVSDGVVYVTLRGGRPLRFEARQFPRLADASDDALRNYELLEDGSYIRWPDLDEDLSVEGLFKRVTVELGTSGFDADDIEQLVEDDARVLTPA